MWHLKSQVCFSLCFYLCHHGYGELAFESDINFLFSQAQLFVLRLVTDSHWLWSPLTYPMCTKENVVCEILEQPVALQILCTLYTLGEFTNSNPL